MYRDVAVSNLAEPLDHLGRVHREGVLVSLRPRIRLIQRGRQKTELFELPGENDQAGSGRGEEETIGIGSSASRRCIKKAGQRSQKESQAACAPSAPPRASRTAPTKGRQNTAPLPKGQAKHGFVAHSPRAARPRSSGCAAATAWAGRARGSPSACTAPYRSWEDNPELTVSTHGSSQNAPRLVR